MINQRTVTVRVHHALFDVTLDADGIIDSIVDGQGREVSALMFEMRLTGEIQTEAMTAVAEQDAEAAQLAMEAKQYAA